MESSEEYLSKLQRYIESWVVEKSRSVLENVVELYEDFRKRDDLPEEFVKTFQLHLHSVIYNSTKILSFATSKEWAVRDPYSIWEQGRTELDEVLVKYALLDKGETAEAKKRARIQSLLRDLEELKELLSETRYPSRTWIHGFLLRIHIQDPLLAEISHLTERVTMGELSWDEYVNSASRLVENLLAKYREIQRQNS
jgi:aminopeptidase-like protein